MRRPGLALALALVLVGRTGLAQTDPSPPSEPGPSSGNQAPAAQPTPPPAWLPREGADLVALDKVSAKTLALTLTTGQVARFGSLSIALKSCFVRPPDQAPDATVWLDITDSKSGAPEFHGWMIRSAPAVSAFQHPVYDVRLLGCH